MDKCIYVDLPLKLGNNLLKQEALSNSAEDHGCLRKHKQEKILWGVQAPLPRAAAPPDLLHIPPRADDSADMLKSILKGQTWIEVSNWPGLVSSIWHPIHEKNYRPRWNFLLSKMIYEQEMFNIRSVYKYYPHIYCCYSLGRGGK